MNKYDVIIIGAGAAGLMCAIEAGKRGRRVLVLDHANKPGKKILMSGGGRCNFTNYHIHPDCYISNNPDFCKSALKRYTQWDFIELVKKYHIPFHEKTLGQLFCDDKSKAILEMLLAECAQYSVPIQLETTIEHIANAENYHFKLRTSHGEYETTSLVIATGGLSIPTMGASPFAYRLAAQFDIKVWPTRAGLVPFTLAPEEKDKWSVLSGVSLDSLVSTSEINFREDMLFTHRGLSGPSMLQISSYWQPGTSLQINLLPSIEVIDWLKAERQSQPQKQLKTILSTCLPRRLTEILIDQTTLEKKLGALSNKEIEQIAAEINDWAIQPNGTEGYRTAEVTLGGVDCHALSSKTMEATKVPGLYFIGEAVDVTGWLGGYNFQWAWSSGWAAGQVV